jgi:hypothetical protein
MRFNGLSFVTHREVEALLGGGDAGSKQRRRLVQRGWLPEAPMVPGDRDRLAIYPEFALAALVVSASASKGLRRPVESAALEAGRLYQSKAYRRFETALAQALRDAGSRDVVAFARCVAEVDFDAFTAWREEVKNCVEALASVALYVEALLARVIDVDDRYVVEVGGVAEPHPIEDAPQPLSLGDLVTRDRVHVASAVRAFLLPVPDLDVICAAADDEDALARALFDGLQGQVRVLPLMPAAKEPVYTGAGEVDVPWHLLAGANSMSRKTHASS